ncbi:MAG TPA: hypothetical protein VLH39_04600, partial [Magnetospirillaceae bacterium]|nr:hypothetical protein [Magnetospirillaceae bacterium]
LTARGNVEYERRSGGIIETFYGESLTIDLDSWQGRFLDGRSVRSPAEGMEEGKLIFAADDILRLEGGALALKNGLITSSVAEDPYWSIRASRIWLLSDTEWAVANAVLSVGHVPVLYLPFFYYPGLEVVFNPAIGFREREGRFVQTTTYLVGEKPETDEDGPSLFRTIQAGPGNERELRGVFLRETNRPRAAPSRDMFKLLADVYTNLGALLGLEAFFESAGPLRNLRLSVGLGFSRSVFFSGGNYTPFVAAGDFGSVWNSSVLGGLSLPFRYSLSLETQAILGPLTASISLPAFSDPFFEQDFWNRSEDMNWLKFQSGAAVGAGPGETRSYTQRIALSGSLPADDLAPWVHSLTLDRLASSLHWRPIQRTAPVDPPDAVLFAADPQRKFFAPELFTILDAALTLRGELASFRPHERRESEPERARDVPVSETGLEPDIEPPWGSDPDPKDSGTGSCGSGVGMRMQAVSGDPGQTGWNFLPPPPSGPPSRRAVAGLSGGITYTISPSARYERRYPTASWSEPEDIDGQGLYDLFSYRLTGSLEARSSWASDLLTTSLALTWNSQAQVRTDIDMDRVTAAQRNTWEVRDARFRFERATGTLRLGGSPFRDLWLLAPTSFSYTLTGFLYSTAYREGSAPLGAVHDVFWPDWSRDTIRAHSLTATFGIRPQGFVQSLTLTSTLPPRLESYDLDLRLSFPYVEVQGATRYYRPAEGAAPVWDSLTTRVTLQAEDGPSLSNQFIWDIETGRPVSNTAVFEWGGFEATLAARRSRAFDLSLASGWQAYGVETLRLSEAAATFRREVDLPLSRTGAVRLRGSINAEFSQSLLRATESVLALTYGLKLTVPGILDLEVSGTAQNSSVWRYAPAWFGMSEVDGVRFEPVNLPRDLWDSISVWDITALRRALFKLKGLRVSATHYMEDWDLVFEYRGTPRLNTTRTPYFHEFVSSFSLLLTWRTLPQITTSIVRDEDGLRTE